MATKYIGENALTKIFTLIKNNFYTKSETYTIDDVWTKGETYTIEETEQAISDATKITSIKAYDTTLTPSNKVVTIPLATTSKAGLMSANDKTNLNNLSSTDIPTIAYGTSIPTSTEEADVYFQTTSDNLFLPLVSDYYISDSEWTELADMT